MQYFLTQIRGDIYQPTEWPFNQSTDKPTEALTCQMTDHLTKRPTYQANDSPTKRVTYQTFDQQTDRQSNILNIKRVTNYLPSQVP